MVGAVSEGGRGYCGKWDAPEFVAQATSFKHRASAVGNGDVFWVENLEFLFIEDGDVATVAGLSHGEKRHVDAGDAVGQGCFRREGQG